MKLWIAMNGFSVEIRLHTIPSRKMGRTILAYLLLKLRKEIKTIRSTALFHSGLNERVSIPTQIRYFDGLDPKRKLPRLQFNQWGLWLRLTREGLRLTQDDLARISGISRTMISHLEHGKFHPRKSTRSRLEEALMSRSDSVLINGQAQVQNPRQHIPVPTTRRGPTKN